MDTSGGTPRLAIDMDPAAWGRKRAVYARGSGTAALVFAHEVVEPNYSTRGVAVLADTLALNGGSIRSAASGAEASLTHAGLPHDAAHKVDWRLSPRNAARRAATPDTTPPELVRGEIDGGTVTLTFSEALDPDSVGGEFWATVYSANGSAWSFVAAGDVEISGNVVTVGLGPAGPGKPWAKAGVPSWGSNRLQYDAPADPDARQLRDLAGNAVGDMRSIALDNLTAPPPDAPPSDTTPPELVRGEIDGGTVTLTFSEALDPDSVGGRFWATVYSANGSAWSFVAGGDVEISGNVVTVGLGPAGPGKPWAKAGVPSWGSNRLQYDAPADPGAGQLRDLAGNAVGNMRSIALDNVTAPPPDTTPPRLSRTVVDGAKLTLAFNEAIDAAASLSNGAFAVKKTPPGGTEQTVGLSGTPAVEGAAVTLSLAQAVRSTDRDVKVSYRRSSDAGNRLRDEAGNEVAGFSDRPVANIAGDTTPPELLRGEIDGATMTLYFSEALDPDATAGTFKVSVQTAQSSWRSFTATGGVEIDGHKVTVGVGRGKPRAKAGLPIINFRYTSPTDPTAKGLRDLADNPVRTPISYINDERLFTQAILLDNVTGAPSVTCIAFYWQTCVAFSSDAGADRNYAQGETIRVTLTFNEAVTVTGAPRVKLDLSSGAGDEKWADYAGGSGTKVLEFAYTVAEGDASTAGVAVLENTLALNGGMIRSAANGEDATLAHAGLGHDPKHRVDSKPHVTGVAITSDAGVDAIYALGETVRVRLTFSEAVAVTGAPRLKLDLGSGTGDERWADYADGNGTAVLEFAYTVAAGDESSAGVAVLENTLALNGGTIKSTTAAGENATLANLGLGHDPAHRMDIRPPTLSAAKVDGVALTLTFDEALGAAASLANGTFTVKKKPQGGTEQTVSLSGSPAVSGATVTLMLANAVRETDTNVKVSYGKPASGAGNRLQDAVGNEVASFTDKPVTNGSRSPGVERAHVDGTALTISFDEALGAAASLASGAFTVKKKPQGGSEQSVSLSGTPAIGGATVTLTLARAVLETDTDVKVSYAKPTSGTGNRLRDAAGNEVASFTDKPATNGSRSPDVERAHVDGTALIITFDEALGAAASLANGAFTVKKKPQGGAEQDVSLSGTPAIGGATVTLTLVNAVLETDTGVKVSYTKPTTGTGNRLRDEAGNEVADFSDVPVTNRTGLDLTPPALSTAFVNEATLTLTFNEAIDAAASLTNGAFTVRKTPQGGTGQTVSLSGAPAIAGAAVTLTLANAVLETDTGVKVSYTRPTSGTGNRLRDEAGNEVADFSDAPVTNRTGLDIAPPVLSAARVNGATLVLTFNESLGAAASLANGAFTVKKTPQEGSEQSVSLSGTPAIVDFTVILTLANAVLETDTDVKVSYAKPTSGTGNRLRDEAGNEVASFSDQAVSTDNTPPRLVRGEIDGGTVTLYFSEPLDPDSIGGRFRATIRLESSGRMYGFTPRGEIEISGNTVTVGLGSYRGQQYRAQAGEPHNILTYIRSTAPTAKSLRDLAGNPVQTPYWRDHDGYSETYVVLDNLTGEPRVTGVAVSSDAGANRTYAQGETIRVTLTFHEAVNVTGAPRVKLDFSSAAGDEKWADYAGGSGTKVLEFAYTVAEGDTSDAGVAVLANTLELNGGTIRSASAADENATLAHAGVGHDPHHRVNDIRPPMLSTASVNGAALKLAFNEPLGAAASLTNGAFTVKKTPQGGIEQDVSLSGTPAIGGATVTLTLANSILETDTDVKVSYTMPTAGTGNRLQDKAGNEVKSFSGEPVMDVSGDTTPPSLVRGEIDGRTMTVYFSEPLDPDSVGGRLWAVVTLSTGVWDGFAATGYVEINGNAVTVGLGRNYHGQQRRAKAGEQANRAYYIKLDDPNAKSLRDLAGNPVSTPHSWADGWLRTQIIYLDNLTGVARLSVADARANEGAGASVAFEVSLSRAAAATVTVDYATADGTAEAGADYTASSGTLTFAAGEAAKTVNVPVLDDAVDEGEETFTLRLSNAQGGWITDGEAVGTITNDDPLQKMWLSRFGRTVASQVTGAVSDRVTAPLAGAQVTVGGQRVDLAQTEDGAALRQALTAVARVLGVSEGAAGEAGPDRFGAGGWAATGAGIGGSRDAGRTTTRDLSGGELLHGSAFHLAEGGDGTRLGLAAWGRVTVGGFAGEAPADAGSVRIDGEVVTGILGADAVWEPLLVGVAVAVSEGEGGYDQPGVDQGTVESTMTTVSPYARLRLHERLAVWGLMGWGTGDMTIVQAANERGQPQRVTRTDLTLRLAGLGGRGALLAAGETGGIDLGLKADAFWAETEAAAVSNEGGTRAEASRVRLALEGGRAIEMGGGAVLTPSVELGVRHDVGDAETGTGVEVGGRVAWEYTEAGLSVEAGGRALLAHEDSAYREWGASGAVRLAPGERGRGLSFSVAPTWGAATSGVQRLWTAPDARGLSPAAGFTAEQRLEGEVGYGLGLFGDRFTGTPKVGFGLSDTAREVRLGWRLTSWLPGDTEFEVNLDASRREAASGNEPSEHRVMLSGTIRW